MSKYVNGQLYGWADISLRLPGGLNVDIQSIEYGDEQEKEASYGLGAAPKGYGRGNYKASCKLTLLRDDYNIFAEWCKQGGKPLYGLVLDKIVVCYGHEGERTITDVINKLTITKVDNKGSQNDKQLEVSIELLVFGEIVRDGLKAI